VVETVVGTEMVFFPSLGICTDLRLRGDAHVALLFGTYVRMYILLLFELEILLWKLAWKRFLMVQHYGKRDY
jgi:hypothetical protein